jgi:hypothetical protein
MRRRRVPALLDDAAARRRGEPRGLTGTNLETLVQATIDPDNSIKIGKPKKGKKKVKVNVPNPGQLDLKASKSVKAFSATPTDAGDVVVQPRLKSKAKKKLRKNGRLKVKASFSFTPTGGDAKTSAKKLTLKK